MNRWKRYGRKIRWRCGDRHGAQGDSKIASSLFARENETGYEKNNIWNLREFTMEIYIVTNRSLFLIKFNLIKFLTMNYIWNYGCKKIRVFYFV